MIVVRHTLHVKDGCQKQLVELIKENWAPPYPSPPHGQRIYRYGPASPWGLVIWEQEFASLEEKQAFDKEYWATPGAGEAAQRGMEFIESHGSTTEIWNVEHLE